MHTRAIWIGSAPVVGAFRQMMRDDRKRLGLSVARAWWLLGVSVRRYRELEEGESYPDFETWDRICEVFNWPRAFATRT
jgi:predicted transcriptional regulator